MNEAQSVPELDENEQIKVRKEKLSILREQGQAYPNDFQRKDLANDLHVQYDSYEKEPLEEEGKTVAVAGRIMTRRIMGKASFVTLQDMSGKIQLYVTRDTLPEGFAPFPMIVLFSPVSVDDAAPYPTTVLLFAFDPNPPAAPAPMTVTRL